MWCNLILPTVLHVCCRSGNTTSPSWTVVVVLNPTAHMHTLGSCAMTLRVTCRVVLPMLFQHGAAAVGYRYHDIHC